MPRTLVLLLVCSLSVAPVVVHARPKADAVASGQAEPGFDRAAFSAEFLAGQTAKEAGKFADAARLWHSAARHMPETRKDQNNRAGLYTRIAGAFVAASERAEDEALLREAVAALDSYIAGFGAAYPGEAVALEVTTARAELQRRLAALEEARRPPPPVIVGPEPPPAPPPPTPDERRQGRVLQGAGGIVFSVGTIVWLATLPVAYGKMKDAGIVYGSAGCSRTSTENECVQAQEDNDAATRRATTGWVTGSLLLAAGVSMFVVGSVRRSNRSTVTPAVSATSIGLTWQGRF
jgi:hypothetical protein